LSISEKPPNKHKLYIITKKILKYKSGVLKNKECGVDMVEEYLEIEKIEERDYQKNISKAATRKSTLVVLPTGMGKTIIAFRVMARRLSKNNDEKILFLAPTKPLVNQHARDVRKFLKVDDSDVKVFTGEVRPDKRKKLWNEKQIIVSTPQVIKNDLMSQKVSLADVDFLIFDEVHRTTGDYAYVYIGEEFQDYDGHPLGLTASPGSKVKDILSVCETTGLDHVEIRTKYDPDMVNYTQTLEKEWVRVKLTDEHKQVVNKLQKVKKKYVKKLQHLGFLGNKSSNQISRKKLIKAREKIQREIHDTNDSSFYEGASYVASAIKIDHAIAQAETQGLQSVKEYLQKINKEAKGRGSSKASSRIAGEKKVKEVLAMIDQITIDHPKIREVVREVKEQVQKKEDSRIIVFTNYRNTSSKITKRLSLEKGIKPIRFVGQRDKEGDAGLKQSEQIETLDQFEMGTYNVLVATSVGEEGLDIPSTDMVVFYEPVPSEVRTIQRRGRTARTRRGKVVLLITDDTRDEAHYWSSKRKEEKMHRNLMKLRDKLGNEISVGDPIKGEIEPDTTGEDNASEEKDKKKSKNQRQLDEYDEVIEITVDTREQNSKISELLAKDGVKINSEQLSVGDYIVADDIAVERKEVSDFLESITDGRLFGQVRDLTNNYKKGIVIIEGKGLYSKRNISDKAIQGALSSILCDFGASVLFTENESETSSILLSMLERVQKQGKDTGPIPTRTERKKMTLNERKRFILEGLPSISGTLAERLLSNFGNVRNVFTATEGELQEVKGIGKSTAEDIAEVLSHQG